MKKLHDFLEKIDLFVTLVHVLWCVFIVGGSLVIEHRHLIFDVPNAIVCLILVSCVVIGIILQKRLLAAPMDMSSIVPYQIFYYGVPAVINVIRIFFQDVLYAQGWGFMPGLASLGLWITSVGYLGIAIIGCAIFWIVWFIRKKRGEREKSTAWRKIKYVLNAVLFWGLVALILGFGADYLVVTIKKASFSREYERNQAYLEDRLTDLSARIQISDREETIRMLQSEGFSCCFLTEVIAKDPSGELSGYTMEELADQLNGILRFSRVSGEVLSQGITEYQEFTKHFVPQRALEMLNQEILGNAKDGTVSVSAELYVHDLLSDSLTSGYMIAVFDENWNVIRVECSERPLIRNAPY